MEDVAGTENVMAVRQLASLTLSDEERAELKSLTTRRKTPLVSVLALRARIVLTCAEGGQNKEVAAKRGLDGPAVGGGVLWSGAWTAARRAALRAPRTVEDARIEAVIVGTWRVALRTPSIGVPAAWRRPAACRCRPCNVSGGSSGSSRTGPRPSSSPRSKLHGQSARRRGPLHLPAGARCRSMRG